MPDAAYPADLTTLIAQRYTAQGASRLDSFIFPPENPINCGADPAIPTTSGIVVINAGCLGERAEDPATLVRLNDKITTYHPDVILLLEGVNDLDSLAPDTSIAAGVQGIRALISAAHSRNVPVMVGTLLPQIATDLSHGGAPDLIVPFNAQLVPVATNAGATVVDLYSTLMTDVTDWISPYDGLHPTAAGYREMALLWFNAIRSPYELPLASSITTAASSSHAGPPLRRIVGR